MTNADLRTLLGRVDRKDPRSRAFPAPRSGVVRPTVHKHYGSVLFQWIGSCTGHSMAQWLNFKPGHRLFTRYQTDDDAMRLYSRATHIDPFAGSYPPDDTGSSGLAVAKAALEEGEILRYEHAFGIDHSLVAMAGGDHARPLMFGTVWLDDMFELDVDGFLKVGGSEAGGHEWVAFGYGEDRKRGPYVWGQNHWRNWGLRYKGKPSRFKITVPDLDTLLKANGDVIAPVALGVV